jgi:hypothetical protein
LSNARFRLERRKVVQGALGATAAALGVGRAAAQQQLSPAEAEYQNSPKSGLTCAACTVFRPPRSCEIVAGDISPNGWCKFFDLPD